MTATDESLPAKTFVWPTQYLLFSSACFGEEAVLFDSSTVPTNPWSLTINLSAHISYLLETRGMSYTFKNRRVMTTDLCCKTSTECNHKGLQDGNTYEGMSPFVG